MRNPNRLTELYDNIKQQHEKLSDWRFMQLINNFFSWHISTYGTDGFYIEDEEAMKRFDEFIKEMTGE